MPNCQPPVNRRAKMVPEGGFEPPTRGFSILLQPLKYNGYFVNRAKYRINHFKYIANGVQTKMHCPDPSPMKRLTIPHFRQSQTKAAFLIALNFAEIRDAALAFTAITPHDDWDDDGYEEWDDCGMMADGQCIYAGSEQCDWECGRSG